MLKAEIGDLDNAHLSVQSIVLVLSSPLTQREVKHDP